MNSFLFTYLGVGGRGVHHSYSSFWRFSYLFAHFYIFKLLIFSEYKRWDHSICSSSSLHEKRNEPIQIQATHALPYRQFLIGEKDTIFRGFLSIVYTKMFIFLFLTRRCRAEKGVRSMIIFIKLWF